MGPLAPTGDRGVLSASLEELEALWDDAAAGRHLHVPDER